VGAIIRAEGNTRPRSTVRVEWPPDDFNSVAIIGNKNAAVLPEPECQNSVKITLRVVQRAHRDKRATPFETRSRTAQAEADPKQ
jgi:hypothetical protein